MTQFAQLINENWQEQCCFSCWKAGNCKIHPYCGLLADTTYQIHRGFIEFLTNCVNVASILIWITRALLIAPEEIPYCYRQNVETTVTLFDFPTLIRCRTWNAFTIKATNESINNERVQALQESRETFFKCTLPAPIRISIFDRKFFFSNSY